jgi:chemotaxis protein methyltransferase CheR
MSTTITTDDFDFIRALVREQAAIVLEFGKEYLVESRLNPLAIREGLGSIPELVAALRNPASMACARRSSMR